MLGIVAEEIIFGSFHLWTGVWIMIMIVRLIREGRLIGLKPL
jgi:hypothetical protein